jgi:uncharacterized protein
MYARTLAKTLKLYENFPVLAILGPRQSGKTTLVQSSFPKHKFLSLENPTTREFATNEPKRFLEVHENTHGIILDEFQYVPSLLSYIQLDVDSKKRKHYFILTGSQNFLMNQAITQSLAGRVGLLTLLPLSLSELIHNNLISGNVEDVIFRGCYPRLYNENFTAERFYPSYIHTYAERDVRQLVHVGDLNSFQTFIQLCAARIGNLLNLSDLATVCGISVPTAKRWISTLEASYIIFLLKPYFKNFNKRVTKMPKLYFYDTGLACSLLRIETAQQLALHPSFGSLFENFILSDIAKQYCNLGQRPPIYFWRDKNGRLEVDCLIDEGGILFPIEIKSSPEIKTDFFKGLQQWSSMEQSFEPKATVPPGYLVYAGEEGHHRTGGIVLPWKKTAEIINHIRKTPE